MSPGNWCDWLPGCCWLSGVGGARRAAAGRCRVPGPRSARGAGTGPQLWPVPCDPGRQGRGAPTSSPPWSRGAWQRLSCADGSKGPRLYDWALIGTDSPRRHLLARRSLGPGREGRAGAGLLPLLFAPAGYAARAGGRGRARWGVEDCFAEAKNEAGLDHYQVRKYRAWYRHVTLSMLAHAFLAVTARDSRPGTPPASRDEGATAKKGT